MTTQALQKLQLLASKQVTVNKLPITKKSEPRIDSPSNDLKIVEPTLSPENVRFSNYCAQVDRLQAELNIDLQELLYRAIELFYQSEIAN